jgi:2-oxoisovalerate dehydrogenase E2 component (dihydrolipoyl transacylase)
LAMGAMGRVQRLPRFDTSDTSGSTGTVVPVDLLPVSWVGDHRFVDGATLARFHTRLHALIKDPGQMLVLLK